MACTKQRIDIYSPVKCIIYIWFTFRHKLSLLYPNFYNNYNIKKKKIFIENMLFTEDPNTRAEPCWTHSVDHVGQNTSDVLRQSHHGSHAVSAIVWFPDLREIRVNATRRKSNATRRCTARTASGCPNGPRYVSLQKLYRMYTHVLLQGRRSHQNIGGGGGQTNSTELGVWGHFELNAFDNRYCNSVCD